MTAYTLKLYRNRTGAVKEGLGGVTFDVGSDETAIRYLRYTYSERLTDCDHAVLFDEGGKIVWEEYRSDP